MVYFWCAAIHLPRVHPPCPGRDWGHWLRADVQTEWVADDSRSRLGTGCLSRLGRLLRDRIAERSRRSIGDEVAAGDPQCLAIGKWSSRGSVCAKCGRAGCEPRRVWNAHIDRSGLPRTRQTSCQRTRITVVFGGRARKGRSHVQRLLLTAPRNFERPFRAAASHLKLSDNRSWMKPLARQLGGRAAWAASKRAELIRILRCGSGEWRDRSSAFAAAVLVRAGARATGRTTAG